MPFEFQKPVQDTATQTSPPATPQLTKELADPEPVTPFTFGFTSVPQQNLEPTKSHAKIWDFRLPHHNLDDTFTTQTDVRILLVTMMQNGISSEEVKKFLSQFPNIGPNEMDHFVEGFPIIFYAVQTNNEKMIRLIANYATINVASEKDLIPLLAYAIINSQIIQQDTSAAVITLLSLGATAEVIPTAFYSPFNIDLPAGGPQKEQLTDFMDDIKHEWCQYPSMRSKLTEALNITYRYYLDKSTKVPKPQPREKQIAELKDVTPLLGIPYLIIGQTTAATTLRNSLLVYMARKMGPRNRKPLVLVFAGPSGHGKTELANQMSSLLSLETLVIDCPQFSTDTGLFGPRPGYHAGAKGSQLNNFLSKHDNKKCIVFLDEFEKTSEEVHNTLLKLFDEGIYQDRRNLKDVDASQVIWVLATNVADHAIKFFTDENYAGLFNEKDIPNQTRLVKQLSSVIKDVFKSNFGAPITGRVDQYIPFLEFSLGEQLVGVNKYLRTLIEDVRQPVSLAPGTDQVLVGDVTLIVRNDVAVCKLIADENYDRELGIRSLKTATAQEVETVLVMQYLQDKELIRENGGLVTYFLEVRNGELVCCMKKKEEAMVVDDDSDGEY